MRGLVIFLLVIIGIASFSFVAAGTDIIRNKAANANQQKTAEFSIFTSAVCENKEKYVYCKDEVFVKCNDKTSKAADTEECNGFKINVPKVTGSATFSKEWKDPRK